MMILAALQGSIPNWILDQSPRVLTHLIEPATRSLAIAAMAGLVMFVGGVKNLSLRLSVWKLVVCAALAMPILAACLPGLQVPVPVPDRIQRLFNSGVKPQTPSFRLVAHPASNQAKIAPAASVPVIAQRETPTADVSRPHDSYTPSTHIPRSSMELAIYAAGASFLAFRFLLGWCLSRKLRQASRAIRDIGVTSRFLARCAAAQLRLIPRLAESDRLTVPLTCGVVRPAVLLPADWRKWDVEKLDAVLTHEISHVARRDALSERLALLHRSIFWFSPLAWWLPRCVADLAEEASDEAALAAGAEPTRYAEILLGFLEDLNSASWRAHWQGMAMAQAGSAEKRLDRILNGRTIMCMQGKKSFAAILIFASVPVVLVAASLQPHRLGPQIVFSHYPSRPTVQAASTGQSAAAASPDPAVSRAPAASAAPSVRTIPAAPAAVAPVVIVAPVNAVSAIPTPRPIPTVVALARVTAVTDDRTPLALRLQVTPRVQAQAPASPSVPPVPPVVPAPPRSGYSFSYLTDSQNAYAIISGKTQTMSGSFSRRDFARLEALRNQLNGDFIWFERDGKSYVITDPGRVSRAKQAFAKQSELGEKEGELGEQLGKLGELQGQLGEQQGEIGEQMGKLYSNLGNLDLQFPEMKAELEAIQSQARDFAKSAATQFDSEAFRASMEKMQKDLAAAQKAFDANQKIADAQLKTNVSIDGSVTDAAMEKARAALDKQMSELAEQQASLGEKQAKLSQQQEELARQQAEESAKAQAEIKSIIDEAVSRGIAQPAPKQ